MTIFYQRTREEIREHFTHEGWFFLCPIYADMTDEALPALESKNWIPEWWLLANTYFAQGVAYVMSMLDPDAEVNFTMTLRELEPSED